MEGQICTVVSCLPFRVNKNIPHCYPGNFTMPEVKNVFKECEILHVGPTLCQFYVGGEAGDNNDGWIKKTIPSNELAESIARDEVSSCINITPGVVQPAIFWLEGKIDVEKVVLLHHDKLDQYREMQKRWFIELIREADIDFSKLKSPGVVSDLHRKAARALNLKRDWDTETVINNIMTCPSCQAIVNPLAMVCSNCKYIINEELYKANAGRFMGGVSSEVAKEPVKV